MSYEAQEPGLYTLWTGLSVWLTTKATKGLSFIFLFHFYNIYWNLLYWEHAIKKQRVNKKGIKLQVRPKTFYLEIHWLQILTYLVFQANDTLASPGLWHGMHNNLSNPVLLHVSGWRSVPSSLAIPKQRLTKPHWRTVKSFVQGKETCNSQQSPRGQHWAT